MLATLLPTDATLSDQSTIFMLTESTWPWVFGPGPRGVHTGTTGAGAAPDDFRSQGPGFAADRFQERVVLSGQFQDSGSARAVNPEQPLAGWFGQTTLLTKLLAKK